VSPRILVDLSLLVSLDDYTRVVCMFGKVEPSERVVAESTLPLWLSWSEHVHRFERRHLDDVMRTMEVPEPIAELHIGGG
jgi:hypothetical protein